MNKLLTWDQSIDVGDYVFCTYRKNSFIYKVTEVKRRFITDVMRKSYPDVYGLYPVDTEIDPIVEIEIAFDLSMSATRFKRTKTTYDATFIKKVKKSELQDHINRISDMLKLIK